jgi:hypothetical protein
MVRSGRLEDVTAAETMTRAIQVAWLGTSALAAEGILKSTPAVAGLKLATAGATFHFSADQPALAQLLARLVSGGVEITWFGEVKQTVEDLYMKISSHEVM